MTTQEANTNASTIAVQKRLTKVSYDGDDCSPLPPLIGTAFDGRYLIFNGRRPDARHPDRASFEVGMMDRATGLFHPARYCFDAVPDLADLGKTFSRFEETFDGYGVLMFSHVVETSMGVCKTYICSSYVDFVNLTIHVNAVESSCFRSSVPTWLIRHEGKYASASFSHSNKPMESSQIVELRTRIIVDDDEQRQFEVVEKPIVRVHYHNSECLGSIMVHKSDATTPPVTVTLPEELFRAFIRSMEIHKDNLVLQLSKPGFDDIHTCLVDMKTLKTQLLWPAFTSSQVGFFSNNRFYVNDHQNGVITYQLLSGCESLKSIAVTLVHKRIWCDPKTNYDRPHVARIRAIAVECSLPFFERVEESALLRDAECPKVSEETLLDRMSVADFAACRD